MNSTDLSELHRKMRRSDNQNIRMTPEISMHFSHIITRNSNMASIFQYLGAIGPTRQPILITGETGVGKELVAQSIHSISRREGEFVTVNVGGLDDNLFSDNLFGHKKGAYTGANSDRPGLIDRAKGGTLFLDEIGDLNVSSQIKLLRLLQEREYYPLGADSPITTDARFVFATNHEMTSLQDGGNFRPDLYYRLSAHHFEIPPLRERPEDIPPLIQNFVESAARVFDIQVPSYSKKFVSLLSTYHFPGNIRELQNMITDAVVKNIDGFLSAENLRSEVNYQKKLHCAPSMKSDLVNPNSISGLSLDSSGPFPTLSEAENFLLTNALMRADGNQLTAAKLLGISRQSLQRRMKKSRAR